MTLGFCCWLCPCVYSRLCVILVCVTWVTSSTWMKSSTRACSGWRTMTSMTSWTSPSLWTKKSSGRSVGVHSWCLSVVTGGGWSVKNELVAKIRCVFAYVLLGGLNPGLCTVTIIVVAKMILMPTADKGVLVYRVWQLFVCCKRSFYFQLKYPCKILKCALNTMFKSPCHPRVECWIT